MSFSERGQTSNKSHKKGEIGAKEHRAVLDSDHLSHAINTGAGAYELLQKTLNNQPNISPAFHICKQDIAAKWKFPCLSTGSGISWFLGWMFGEQKKVCRCRRRKAWPGVCYQHTRACFLFLKCYPYCSLFDTLDYFYVNFWFLLIFHYCYMLFEFWSSLVF